MAEWSIALVLKTSKGQPFVSSNLTASAIVRTGLCSSGATVIGAADLAARIDRVAALVASARRLLFITGAGISADSGLPTYRGIGGLYDRELTDEGLRIEEALSGEVFAAFPEVTWKYLAQIEEACRGVAPNAAHRAMARIERERPGSLVLTQNIDGLHRRAGSFNLIEIHGNLQNLACTSCHFRTYCPTLEGWEIPPHCPECDAVLRPAVVLFGEALPSGAMDRFLDALEAGFDAVFSIGTSSAFQYIAQPVLWAARRGIPTVEINPGETVLSGIVDTRLPLGAAAAMTALIESLEW